MPNFCRDVLLPAAAAIGLLVALAVGPARAGDEPALPAATDVRKDIAATDLTTQPDSVIDSRCDRVRRIGKFTLTRCD